MTPTEQQNEPRDTPPWWLLPLLLAAVLAGMIGFRLVNQPADTVAQTEAGPGEGAPTGAATGETVSLAIDFGNGARQRFDALEWRAEMTVQDLMQAAAKFRPGIDFSAVGTGESAFLTGIAGIGNDASGGRFWHYWVNDTRGDRSFGVYPLEPGDDVLWKFAPQE